MELPKKLSPLFFMYLFSRSTYFRNFKNNTSFIFYNFNNLPLYHEIFQRNVLQNMYTVIKLLPYISQKVRKGIDDATEGIMVGLNKYDDEITETFSLNDVPVTPTSNTIPEIQSEVQLITLLENLREKEKQNIANDKVSGTIYTSVKDTKKRTELFLSRIFSLYYLTNPLHPDVFPSLRFIERNLVRFSLKLFNADENNGRGILTTGGTESIFLACKAYRDYGIQEKKIQSPEMIVPNTIHPAFDKAAHYLGIKLRRIPYYSKTDYLDLNYLYKMINKNTIMVAASAPNFPYGTCDPIEDIAKITLKYDIPFHVDACLGGFVLAFLKDTDLGSKFNYDFKVNGVTSVSADYHKYALCPKGSSIIMYNSRKYADYQYYVQPNWCGGIYATNSFTGSKSGNITLMTWATIVLNGTKFYKKLAHDINDTTVYLARCLKRIPCVTVIGEPEDLVNVVAFYTDPKVCTIAELNHLLKEDGYNLNQLQSPSAVHLAVTENHISQEFKDNFILAVSQAIKKTIEKKRDSNVNSDDGGAAIYGSQQQISDSSIIDTVARNYLDLQYS
tara:strand:+ start:185 stop:1861 length:1677 start_codon:yes stop_codon:yes gene_type:complete